MGRMVRLSTLSGWLLVGAACALGAGRAAASSPPGPVHTLYLFGASWCAPCIAELRELKSLASAAAPDRIVVVWLDPGIERISLPSLANVEVAGRAQARRLGGERAFAGVPYAVMVDAGGAACAERRGPLSAEEVRRLRRGCEDGSGH